ncbi:hypothetical protein AXX12_00970 [Anaerosporomusa subterranea]|uniref:Cyclic nucleotide-binding domain-containing protein n=1 Tax=Anaerosporomusa subterranea TaxID=1794912 RepID=A0A154BXF0_ANASB|nr:cyclic nucleotide-binding domain-containing protein [Anaerosporomusa subterranea]KYZ78148.1 hypothetical protein AXX12_00970 [Anaerosporomusa subterranea]
MNDMTSELMGKSIYDFLSPEQRSRIPVAKINKNTVFIPAMAQENIDLYYILEGKVEVLSQAYNGRSFLVDALGPGEFVGKFSQMRKQNFYCEIKTNTSCTLLKLTEIKNELLNNERFLLFFYCKTSSRIYEMYKISMARTLFTYEELLAYYLLDLANEAGFIGDKDTTICLKTNISERQYYYLMKKFRNGQMISHDKKGIYILDLAGLQAIAANVIKFMKNRI